MDFIGFNIKLHAKQKTTDKLENINWSCPPKVYCFVFTAFEHNTSKRYKFYIYLSFSKFFQNNMCIIKSY